MPPDDYFDGPQRLINLAIVLYRRDEEHRELSDLEHSLEKSEQALQLLPPSCHPASDRFLGLTAISWELQPPRACPSRGVADRVRRVDWALALHQRCGRLS